jgi:hypothetical protein
MSTGVLLQIFNPIGPRYGPGTELFIPYSCIHHIEKKVSVNEDGERLKMYTIYLKKEEWFERVGIGFHKGDPQFQTAIKPEFITYGNCAMFL